MGIEDESSLHRIDQLCRQAQAESDPTKIADNLREVIRELGRLLDAIDEALRAAAERDEAAAPKRWVV